MVLAVDMLSGLGIAWGVVTAVLVLVLIYRSTVEMHEDDQLFLDRVEEKMEVEQKEVIRKIQKLGVCVKTLGIASGVLLLVITGIWIWQGVNATR